MSFQFPRFALPTLGGGRFWEEVSREGAHRLQRHRWTGHHRVLNEANICLAWGRLEHCREALAELTAAPASEGLFNIPMPTLGGMQMWADEVVRHGWRIQRQVLTGHCRLLDPDDRRHAWGTFGQCETALRRLEAEGDIADGDDHLVVLVHGIFGWKDRWEEVADELRQRGFEPVGVNYPSTRMGIEEHVEQLARVIENLPPHSDLSFVTHSMGALVVRRLLADHPSVETRRVVMLAPPNRGAVIADLVCDLFPYQLVFGPSGQELVTRVNSSLSDLPTPPCEFAVIAGGRGNDRGFNPLITGDDDGVVEVASTHLEGMADFMLVERTHNRIFRAPEVIEAVANFIESGRLRAGAASAETSAPSP